MSLADLEERLAGATGGDRELDVAIMCAIGGAEQIDAYSFHGPGETIWYRGDYEEDASAPPLPYVTASVDSALALVERVLPGWMVAEIVQTDRRGWFATLVHGVPSKFDQHVGSRTAPTPALALCLALIRAVRAQAPETL